VRPLTSDTKGGITMTNQALTTEGSSDNQHGLGARLDEIAWALFLIMTGALWLTPGGWAPDGTWLVGLGLILLGWSGARRFSRRPVSASGIAVGITALVAGVGRILGGAGLFIPVLLVALGIVLATRTITKAGHAAASR
jgi:hypothetical protein